MISRWWRDLSFGLRLAVGGSRGSTSGWMRLTLGAVGVALAVVLLLAAASIGTVTEVRAERQSAQMEDHRPRSGVDPLYTQNQHIPYQGVTIAGVWAYPESASSPLLPGLSRQLRPGEVAVSPELRRLLASEPGELLRPRFDGLRIVGTLDESGLVAPGDLRFVVGAGAELKRQAAGDELGVPAANRVYGFGGELERSELPTELVMLIVVGTVALLVPVLIFVVSSTRIAGAERDRRLAALRLVGADTRQVRRIAAAEALLPAFAGLVLGGALFASLRPFTEDLRLFGTSVFASDIAPSLQLVVLIAFVVPVLSVLTAIVAMRRLVVEPLGVVRQGKPRRRRLWWRIATLAAGIGLLINPRELSDVLPSTLTGRGWTDLVIAGSCLVLFGVAMLLPWAVEGVIGRIRGGSPSWQLAIRRLQLDSGTSSRVISGVVVVLTGAIALQVTMSSIAEDMRRDAEASVGDRMAMGQGMLIRDSPERLRDLGTKVRDVPGVSGAHLISSGHVEFEHVGEQWMSVLVAGCDVLTIWTSAVGCRDGDVFLPSDHGGATMVKPGDRLTSGESGRSWQVPREAKTVGLSQTGMPEPGDILFTPAAWDASALASTGLQSVLYVVTLGTGGNTGMVERVRNAAGLHTAPPVIYGGDDLGYLSDRVREFVAIKSVLLAGSVFVLLVAALGVLMMSVEQVRERRRALAAVAASGVSFATLARSLLWQNAVPLAIGAVLSTIGGGLLAFLVLQLANTELYADGSSYAAMVGVAGALVLFVTVLSLPMLRAAVSVKNLRTE